MCLHTLQRWVCSITNGISLDTTLSSIRYNCRLSNIKNDFGCIEIEIFFPPLLQIKDSIIMFSVVVFDDENSVEGVPSSWIKKLGNQTYCYWPPRHSKDRLNIYNLIRKEITASTDWNLLTCRIKCETESFKDMRRKVKHSEIVSTDTDSENIVNLVPTRQSKEQAKSSDDEFVPPIPQPSSSKKICEYLEEINPTS